MNFDPVVTAQLDKILKMLQENKKREKEKDDGTKPEPAK